MSSTSIPSREDEGVVGQASAKVQDAASTAQEKASELTSEGKSRLAEQLDQRTTDAGSQARSVAQALRSSTDQLQQDGNTQAASVANRAADQIERIGSYLEQHGGDDLLRDVENFARRRPWMIAGAGLLVGITASRFLKASSEKRYSAYTGSAGYRSPRAYGTYGAYGEYGEYGEYGGSRDLPQVTGGGYVGTTGYSSPAADDPLAPER